MRGVVAARRGGALCRQEPVEERAVAGQHDAQILRRDVVALRPLVLEALPLAREAPGDALHEIRDERVCLLDQYWIKDDKKKIKDLITEKVAKIGENITVRRFAKFVVGEGIEKKKENLAEEVAKTIGQA